MEHLNTLLFLWLNAPLHADPWTVTLANFCAEWLLWFAPVLMGYYWLRGNEQTRKTLLVATASAAIALLVNQAIGLIWFHPRPFMIGLGHTLITHAPDSSFPSDHLTFWWAITFSLLIQPGRHKRWPAVFAVAGLPIAWARIYLGVHFPFDMIGAAAVAACSAWLASRSVGWYLEPCYQFFIKIHHVLFRRLIERGLVHN